MNLKNSLLLPILCLVVVLGILIKLAGDGLNLEMGPGMHLNIPPLPMNIQFAGPPTPTPTPSHLHIKLAPTHKKH